MSIKDWEKEQEEKAAERRRSERSVWKRISAKIKKPRKFLAKSKGSRTVYKTEKHSTVSGGLPGLGKRR